MNSTTAVARGLASRLVLPRRRAAARVASLAVGAVVALVLAPTTAHAGKIVADIFPKTADYVSEDGDRMSIPTTIAIYKGTADHPADPSAAGDVFVADPARERIHRFAADGTFKAVWGWDVIESSPTGGSVDLGDAFEICTVAEDCKRGSSASGPGAFDRPGSIAIDQTTGHVFVKDIRGARVQEFDIDGEFVRMWGWDVIAANVPLHANDNGTGFEVCDVTRGNAPSDCKLGVAGDGAGQFGFADDDAGYETSALAVSPVDGSLLVSDPENRRVQQFDPDAPTIAGVFLRAWGWDVVPGGTPAFEICIAVCQQGIENVFGPNGAFGNRSPQQIAIDSQGVLYAKDYVGFPLTTRISRFDTTKTAAGELLGSPVLVESQATYSRRVRVLSIDPDDDGAGPDYDRLFVGRNNQVYEEYSLASGSPVVVDSHLTTRPPLPSGMALNPGYDGGTLYVTTSDRLLLANDAGAGAPGVSLAAPTDVGETTATFHGTVDPEDFPTRYRFEYSTNGTDWTATAESQPFVGGTPVEADVTGLEAGTEYQVRLVGTKDYGAGTGTTAPLTFVTESAAPLVDRVGVVSRNTTRALVRARINPNSAPTAFQVHYGTTSSYGLVAPLEPADAGSAGTPETFAVLLDGLSPDTAYHFKFVATSEEGTTESADRAFVTRATAPPPPPGRGYELVSPADKLSGGGVGGYQTDTHAAAAGPGAVSVDGERVAVTATHGVSLTDGGFSYASDFAFAQRTANGWVSHSPFTRPNYLYAGNRFARLRAHSDDLSLMFWGTNAGSGDAPDPSTRTGLAMFPEVADLPYNAVVHLSDWHGRWEVFGPVAPGQGTTADGGSQVSGDGTHATLTSEIRGLAGPADPTLDQLAGGTTYMNDLSVGVSDTFPGTGIRTPVGICTEGTTVPTRAVSGQLVTSPCGAPAEGRDAALISPNGAALGDPGSALQDVISHDGRRLFFMSPDPRLASSFAPCSGSGGASSCPAQLFVYDERGGEPATRWISTPTVAGQAASLLGPTYFDGATPDGDKVFFHTTSPLTADDPNGVKDGGGETVAPPPGGVTTGSASYDSWDLYMYDFPDDPEADLGDGELVRVSAGPTGIADSRVTEASSGGAGANSFSLRFASDDGSRVYFSTRGAIPDAALAEGATTTPAASGGESSLYLFDANRPPSERWTFIARLGDSCAISGGQDSQSLSRSNTRHGIIQRPNANCVRGTSDGTFVTFPSQDALVEGDADDGSGDMYAFQATTDELTRISAPQGTDAETYGCIQDSGDAAPTMYCYGDMGASESALPGVITDPDDPAEHTAFFHSRSGLVPEDTDGASDVYQWRDGELSVLSTGTDRNVFYAGNSSDGEDVFVMTREQLSWEDWDAVLDIYDARVGGGFPEPPPESPGCSVLGDDCQGAGRGAPGSPSRTSAEGVGPGDGNALPSKRLVLRLSDPTAVELRRAARSGVLRIKVRASAAGAVSAVAKARIRVRAKGRYVTKTLRVARARRRAVRPNVTTTLALRLSKAARRELSRRRNLRIAVVVTNPGAKARTKRLRLKAVDGRRGGR
jgi:hypothetical protein